MKRRDWIRALTGGSALLTIAAGSHAREKHAAGENLSSGGRGSFAIDGHRVRFFHPAIQQSFNMVMLADTHLYKDDTRGDPYRSYSGRMAKAYNQTKHFQTGAPTNPEESFVNTLAIAAQRNADMVAMVGDIFSFPSEAAVEWAMAEIKKAGLPYVYTAGNHDWHYEGMEGSLQDLRATWINQRLLPLYQQQDPMMSVREMHGVRLITLDNSNYEILPGQLAFFQKEVATSKPLLLMMHIPLYAPGRPMGFGCGHPQWGAAADRGYQLERRPRWPESGHSQTTLDFHQAVFAAPNLLGILAGHIHQPSVDVVNGIPQVVAEANATGAYLAVEFGVGG